MVSAGTKISDSVKYLRNSLSTLVVDPISGKRSGRERFVMTGYPERPVKYPVITVMNEASSDIQRLGMRSEETAMRLNFEVRIWARNNKERDTLFEEVYEALRENQFGASSSSDTEELHDFSLVSAVNVDEPGGESPKSKVCTFSYMFVTE